MGAQLILDPAGADRRGLAPRITSPHERRAPQGALGW